MSIEDFSHESCNLILVLTHEKKKKNDVPDIVSSKRERHIIDSNEDDEIIYIETRRSNWKRTQPMMATIVGFIEFKYNIRQNIEMLHLLFGNNNDTVETINDSIQTIQNNQETLLSLLNNAVNLTWSLLSMVDRWSLATNHQTILLSIIPSKTLRFEIFILLHKCYYFKFNL